MSLTVVDVVVVGDVMSVGTLDEWTCRKSENNNLDPRQRVAFSQHDIQILCENTPVSSLENLSFKCELFPPKKPLVGKTFADTLVGLSRAKKHRSQTAAQSGF